MEAALRGALSAHEGERKAAEEVLAHAERAQANEPVGQLALALAGYLVARDEVPCAETRSMRRLAAVLLRRVTLERDDMTVLDRLLAGCALVTDEPGLQAGLAQVICTMVMRGPPTALVAKFNLFIGFADSCRADPARASAFACCVHCAKVFSLNARRNDGVDVDLSARLSPLLRASLVAARDGQQPPATVARAAYAMRKLAQATVVNSAEHGQWLTDLLAVAQAPVADSVHVRCEILRALRALCALARRGSPRPHAAVNQRCFELAAKTLQVVVPMARRGAIEEAYDSDDGEPSGMQALVAVTIEMLCDLFPDVASSLTPAAALPELLSLCLAACEPTEALVALFHEEPNEFVALHEDESALNFPRHAVPALIETLCEDWPRAVIEALGAIVARADNPKALESALWVLGNLWFVLSSEGDDDELLDGLQAVLQPLIHRLAAADGGEPLVRARALWAVWACWSPGLATPAVRGFIASSVHAAAVAPQHLVLGLYACRALSRFVGAIAANEKEAPAQLQSLFADLLCVLRSSSFETVHIALETLQVLLEAACQRHIQLDPDRLRELLRLLVELWQGGAEQDPLSRDTCIQIVRYLLTAERTNLALYESLLSYVPTLFTNLLDSPCSSFPEVAGLLTAIRDRILLGLNGQSDKPEPSPVDLLDCLRACLRHVPREQVAESLASTLPMIGKATLGNLTTNDEVERDQAQEELACIAYQTVVEVLRKARHAEDKLAISSIGRVATEFIVIASRFNSDILVEAVLCSLLCNSVAWLTLDAAMASSLAQTLINSSPERPEETVFHAACLSLLVGQFPEAATTNQVGRALQLAVKIASETPSHTANDSALLGEDMWLFGCDAESNPVSHGNDPLFASDELMQNYLEQATETVQQTLSRIAERGLAGLAPSPSPPVSA